MAKIFGFNYSMLHILSQSKDTRYFQIKSRDKLLLSIDIIYMLLEALHGVHKKEIDYYSVKIQY